MNDGLFKKILILTAALLLVFAVYTQGDAIRAALRPKEPIAEIPAPTVTGNERTLRYGVSSASSLASAVGVKVLEAGGNAVDAAVAISFALSVVDPQNSGIGGGGGMLINDTATGKKVFYDYYIAAGSSIPSSNIGIPGFLKGMELVTRELGTLPLSTLIDYALDLGRQGITVTASHAKMLNLYSSITLKFYEKDGQANNFREGDVIYPRALLATLAAVKANGVDTFYAGEDKISRDFLSLTGISRESLGNYQVIKREPVAIDYRGYSVLAAPPPFSGIVTLQGLLLEEKIDLPPADTANQAYNEGIRDLASFMARESLRHLGDPDYIADAAWATMLDLKYLVPSYSEHSGRPVTIVEPETDSTTGFVVIDKNGMIVAATNTLSSYWGSGVVRAGVVYNNALKNFSVNNNKAGPNKRPKTGISPLILTNASGHKEGVAASGGVKIPITLVKTIVNSKKDGIDLQRANDMTRIYYRYQSLYFEANPPWQAAGKEKIAYSGSYSVLDSKNNFGLMQGLAIDSAGNISGHSDKRGYIRAGSVYFDGENIVCK